MMSMKTIKHPDPYIYHRMVGYMVTIILHVGNSCLVLWNTTQVDLNEDEDIKELVFMRARFLTCWNFFLQVVYATVGLVCDMLLLQNAENKTYRLPKYLHGYRDTLFGGVVWPLTWVVFVVFWPLFIYDRSLIFPKYVDKVIPFSSNLVMHFAILPIVCWEIFFRPRSPPRSHKHFIIHHVLVQAAYSIATFYTYYDTGLWPYPLFKLLYPTMSFYALFYGVTFSSFVYYYMQWPITKLIWGSRFYIKEASKIN